MKKITNSSRWLLGLLAVGCATSQPTDVYPPVGQCVGEVMAGGTGFFGCWSVH